MNRHEQLKAINQAAAESVDLHGLQIGDLTLDGSRHKVKLYEYVSVATFDVEHSSGVIVYRTTVRVETVPVDWR